MSGNGVLRGIACLLLLTTAGKIQANDWIDKPYRIRIWLACDNFSSHPGSFVSDEIAGRIAAKIEAEFRRIMGATARVDSGLAPNWLGATLVANLPPPDVAQVLALAPEIRTYDKLFVVVWTHESESEQARVWQCTIPTRTWGSATIIPELTVLARERQIAGVLRKTLIPLATINRVREKSAMLQVRAGLLIQETAPDLFPQVGDLFEAVTVRTSGSGDRQATICELVPWTVLRAVRIGSGDASCELSSGLRNPLRVRSAGRGIQYAVAVHPDRSSTILHIETVDSPPKPLAAYGVWTRPQDSKAKTFLGRTNSRADIEIPVGVDPLQILFVQNGNQSLARLPVIVGVHDRLTVVLPDDRPRMQAEGTIRGFQERIIDVTAHRKVTMARIRILLATGKSDQAQVLGADLLKLASRDDFIRELTDWQREFSSPHRGVQARIDQLFATTRRLVQQQSWDETEMAALLRELAGALVAKPAGKP